MNACQLLVGTEEHVKTGITSTPVSVAPDILVQIVHILVNELGKMHFI